MTAVRRACEGLLDLVYPPACLLCGNWDTPLLCPVCVAGFPLVPEPLCAACGHPQEEGVACRLCTSAAEHTGGWAFASVRGGGLHRGTLRYALHLLKYRQKDQLGLPLGAWLANRLVVDKLLPPVAFDAVVALPLTPAKARARGYNQARLLAVPVAELLGVPLLPDRALHRVRSAEAQMTLGARRRAANSHPDDFAVDTPSVRGKHLLLVDDVMTTGATLHAAAAALRAAGAGQVDAVVLSLG